MTAVVQEARPPSPAASRRATRPSVWMVAIVRPSGANAKVRMSVGPNPRTPRPVPGRSAARIPTARARRPPAVRADRSDCGCTTAAGKPRSGIASTLPRRPCGSGRSRWCRISCVASPPSLPEVRPRQSGLSKPNRKAVFGRPDVTTDGAQTDPRRGTGPLGSAALGPRLCLMPARSPESSSPIPRAIRSRTRQ